MCKGNRFWYINYAWFIWFIIIMKFYYFPKQKGTSMGLIGGSSCFKLPNFHISLFTALYRWEVFHVLPRVNSVGGNVCLLAYFWSRDLNIVCFDFESGTLLQLIRSAGIIGAQHHTQPWLILIFTYNEEKAHSGKWKTLQILEHHWLFDFLWS